jgi:3-phosphoglycerate kinase
MYSVIGGGDTLAAVRGWSICKGKNPKYLKKP